MYTRKISWEIVMAGLAFVAIAIYMLANGMQGNSQSRSTETAPPSPPELSHLPSSIVIDLQNLENLENLKNLRNLGNLENLKNLEVELKNLDKLIEERIHSSFDEESLDKSLQQVEQKLREIEKADFRVKLQDKKVYISKDYDIQEADWSEVSPGVFVFRESFSLPDNGSVKLNMAFGNLNIVGGGNSGGELTIHATGDIPSAQQIKEYLRIRRDTASIPASFEISSEGTADLSERINLEATLTVPENSTLDASTRGGHVNANNLEGTHKLFTSGGHIMLGTITGSIQAESRGGHINGENLSGEAVLKTSGGHIQIANSELKLSATTGGGHIEIEDFSGQADTKTSGGNISAKIASANGPLSFTTSAGNINIVLPSSLGAEIDAKGNKISLSDAFQFEGEKSNGRLTGLLNGGGPPLTLVCKFGTITISDE